MEEKKNHKLTDEQFLEALRGHNGIPVLVAKAIQNKYGITYSRQAVRERAQKFPEEMKEMRETIIDYSEARLVKVVTDDSAEPKLSTKVAQYLLNSLGKDRGYGQNGVDKTLNQEPEGYFEIDGKDILF